MLAGSQIALGSEESRMRRVWVAVLLVPLVLLGLLFVPATTVRGEEQPAAGAGIDFRRDVRPIFAEHCYACHGSRQQESDFRL